MSYLLSAPQQYLEVGLLPMPGSQLGGFVWAPPASSLALVIAEVFIGSRGGGEPQMEILVESQGGSRPLPTAPPARDSWKADSLSKCHVGTCVCVVVSKE